LYKPDDPTHTRCLCVCACHLSALLCSEGCLEAELLLNILQARDVRLRPQLQRACSQEEALFCEEVEPGQRAAWLAGSKGSKIMKGF
jgi:hypothetical protein